MQITSYSYIASYIAIQLAYHVLKVLVTMQYMCTILYVSKSHTSVDCTYMHGQ